MKDDILWVDGFMALQPQIVDEYSERNCLMFDVQ